MHEFLEIWHQPVVGALHVLGVAWFGATVWVDAPRLRRIGVAWMVATGAILFALNLDRVWGSTAFRIKLGLLAALVFVRRPLWVVLSLWAGVVFASRGIAYF